MSLKQTFVEDGCKLNVDKTWFCIGMSIISTMYVWAITHGSNFENDTFIYASLVGGTHIANTLTKLKYGGVTNGTK